MKTEKELQQKFDDLLIKSEKLREKPYNKNWMQESDELIGKLKIINWVLFGKVGE